MHLLDFKIIPDGNPLGIVPYPVAPAVLLLPAGCAAVPDDTASDTF